MNPVAAIILFALLAQELLNRLADRLNLGRMHAELPEVFRGYYDEERYRRSQAYLRAQTRLGACASTVQLAALLTFWFLGGFAALDRAARMAAAGEVAAGLIYVGTLALGSALLSLPFFAYHTFVIEERFGFNRTDWKTFCADRVKAVLLALAIGAPLLGIILFLLSRWGAGFWWVCWAVASGVLVSLQVVVPTWIMPLFNKFQPLEDGELKTAVFQYARSIGFPLRQVWVMDGSRRSERSNAFFAGVGRNRRIVLFDTLLARHTVPELLAVLAHEMGHFKRRHVTLRTLLGIGQAGLMLFLFSRVLAYPPLFDAFYMERMSVHAGLVFFALLYSPLELALATLQQALFRRHEFAADRFAVATTGDPRALGEALKKLAAHNLSNLSPHPFYVLLHYSHPPPVERLEALAAPGPT